MSKYLFYLKAIILFVVFPACKGPTLLSDYKTANGRHELSFNTDKSFNYKYHYGWYHFASSTGKYSLNKKELTLWSTYQEVKDTLIIPANIYESSSNEDSITIAINAAKLQDSLCYFGVALNGVNKVVSKNNTVKFGQDLVPFVLNVLIHHDSTIAIAPIPIRNVVAIEEYKIKNQSSNLFTIDINVTEDVFYYRTMNNDTINFKGKRLYWKTEEEIFKPVK